MCDVGLPELSGNVTLFPCFLVDDGQCPHPRGSRWAGRTGVHGPGKETLPGTLSSTPAGDLPARPHPVLDDDSPVTPASPGPLCPPVPCLHPTSVPVG